MILISSDPNLSRVASQIERSVAFAKIKKQFIIVPTPSRLLNRFFSFTRWSENSLTKKQNRKLKLSFLFSFLLFGSSAFSDVVIGSTVRTVDGRYFVVGSYYADRSSGQSCDTNINSYPNFDWVAYDQYSNLLQYNTCSNNGYHYVITSLAYWGTLTSNQSACPSGQILDSSGACRVPALSDYDKNPQDCNKYGGYYYSSGIVQSGSTVYTIPLLFSSLTFKSNYQMVTHCGTLGDVAGQVASNVIPLLSIVSPLFRSSKLAQLARYGYSEYLRSKSASAPTTTAQNDYYVGMPRLPAPSSPSMQPVIPVVETPIPPTTNPTTGTSGPSREPNVTPSDNYAHVDDSYIPATASGDPIVDYSVVDRFNGLNGAMTSQEPLTQLVPDVGTSSLPVKESFDLSQFLPNSDIPNDVANVPATTTKNVTFSGQDPIDEYTTTKSYPDGSSLSQVVKINRATKEGFVSSTTLSSFGDSSTLSFRFRVPTYNGVLAPTDTILPPLNQTFSTPVTSPTTSNTVTPSASAPVVPSMNNPDSISGQDATTIINAKMPNYSFPAQSNITPFSVDSINQLLSNSQDMLDNIVFQFSNFKSTFDTTKDLISGGWAPPIIPPGSCGQFMAFDFHNKHVDLCPPLAQETAKIAPLVTLLLTFSGLILAIRIYISALRD
jgi:hypothetical protein